MTEPEKVKERVLKLLTDNRQVIEEFLGWFCYSVAKELPEMEPCKVNIKNPNEVEDFLRGYIDGFIDQLLEDLPCELEVPK